MQGQLNSAGTQCGDACVAGRERMNHNLANIRSTGRRTKKSTSNRYNLADKYGRWSGEEWEVGVNLSTVRTTSNKEGYEQLRVNKETRSNEMDI